MSYDVAVVGLGGHGSAAVAYCAAAGLSVCGVDAYDPPHSHGSHHGESRIIRQAYYEHPSYVPLLLRAYGLWDRLGLDANETLLQRTGGLMIGPGNGELVPGALDSAKEFDLPYRWLDSRELVERFPLFRSGKDAEAVFEPDAGILRPEACIRAHLRMAERHGAVLRRWQRAMAIESGNAGVEIELRGSDGSKGVIKARRAVVTVGSGLADLPLPTARMVRVERQVVAHFNSKSVDGGDALRRLPIFAVEETDGRFYYGFPDLGTGVKVARHHGGDTSTNSDVNESVQERDVDELRQFLSEHLPDANGALASATVCRYTNTADQHFLIDRSDPRVLVISACSGHGFKFAPVIGEIAASLVQGHDVGHDIALFDSARRLQHKEQLAEHP